MTEGEKNADVLISAGIVATTVLSHKWAPECVTALSGCHLIILEDHDESGRKLAADAKAKLSPVAASIRVVPYPHLWQHLDPAKRGAEPTTGEDVSDWFTKGGDPAQLLGICQEILVEGARIIWLDIAKWDHEPTPDLDWAVYNRCRCSGPRGPRLYGQEGLCSRAQRPGGASTRRIRRISNSACHTTFYR